MIDVSSLLYSNATFKARRTVAAYLWGRDSVSALDVLCRVNAETATIKAPKALRSHTREATARAMFRAYAIGLADRRFD